MFGLTRPAWSRSGDSFEPIAHLRVIARGCFVVLTIARCKASYFGAQGTSKFRLGPAWGRSGDSFEPITHLRVIAREVGQRGAATEGETGEGVGSASKRVDSGRLGAERRTSAYSERKRNVYQSIYLICREVPPEEVYGGRLRTEGNASAYASRKRNVNIYIYISIYIYL